MTHAVVDCAAFERSDPVAVGVEHVVALTQGLVSRLV